MPVVTTRLLIVATAADRALVNNTLALMDPSAAGPVLVVGLRRAGDATNAVAAFWASWAMDEKTRQGIMRTVRDAGWKPVPTVSEVKVYSPGDVVPAFGTQRMWLFEGDVYEPDAALRVLGLSLMAEER